MIRTNAPGIHVLQWCGDREAFSARSGNLCQQHVPARKLREIDSRAICHQVLFEVSVASNLLQRNDLRRRLRP